MHELSVAQSLVDVILAQLCDEGLVRVSAVFLRIGPLGGVFPRALRSAFGAAAAGTALGGARLEIEETPLVVWCPACRAEKVLPDVGRLRCPACGRGRRGSSAGRNSKSFRWRSRMQTLTAPEAPTLLTPARPPSGRPRMVEVRQQVLKKNDVVARALRERFRAAGVFVVGLVSSPGAGKTAFLRETLRMLHPASRVAALVGDLATENDAKRLAESGAPVRQIVTGTVCHLEAEMVENALTTAGWDLAALDFLFIENVGNLVCPASYDLGEDLRLVLLSTTEGEDKPLKYPTIFNTADVAVVTKSDLAEPAGFDRAAAHNNIQDVRPGLPVLEVSSKTGAGMSEWVDFLRACVAKRRAAAEPARAV